MDLKIKDIAEYLHVSEKTVYRWVRSGKIPNYKVNNQYRFKKAEIEKWVLQKHSKKNNVCIDSPVIVSSLIDNGGIYYRIEGDTVKNVLYNAVSIIKIPKLVSTEVIFSSLFNREEMMSTGIGKGIAFPHPRDPIITDIYDESISICFLDHPIDYGAVDNKPVQVIFIMLSISTKRHLELMAKISYLCQQKSFINLLETQANRNDILGFIKEVEKKQFSEDL